METKVVSFEQMPELIQNLVERIEALEKTVREKQQPQPLEGGADERAGCLQATWQIQICGVPNGEMPRHSVYPPGKQIVFRSTYHKEVA